MPPEFEAYARVLHNFEAAYDEIDNPLAPSEKAVLKIPDCEPLQSFIQNRRTTSPTGRIKWQELAELLHLPFAPEISFSWFRKKMDGWCVSRLLEGSRTWPIGRESEEVASVLKVFSADQECFFRFPDRSLYTMPDRPLLLKGSLRNVAGYLKTERYPYLKYWWPSDRQWCLCDDDDVGVTIVADPRKLVSALMANSFLECIEVGPMTRVDGRVPIPEV